MLTMTPSCAWGGSDPEEESYCHYVANGGVPEFLADPRQNPVTATIPATFALPVGTHFSVPLRMSDGTLFGTFCGFSFRVLSEASDADLSLVRVLAELVTDQVEHAARFRRARDLRRSALLSLRPDIDLQCVLQPIVELATGRPIAYEALARFPSSNPAELFAEAWELGVGNAVELVAVEHALDALTFLPAGCAININVAPQTLVDGRLTDCLLSSDPGRVVVELTEHTPVDDYVPLIESIRDLKARGVRIAIDDVGTGISGLDHILRLEPDILKIDGAIVRDVDQRAGKQAMVSALVAFSSTVGMDLVAEQVESEREMDTLIDLGVGRAQGYYLGRPTTPASLLG